ncbi:saccharopine dehydrogenase NADP-binding domain-containing protein [Flavobacteriaceae bacterium F89]|uniref:Saccharopine dehydrogenase NADP-binding domain-containing protein n=1 Tax=Cerina litoralis TaxID=2874477 RepID=A0AAE3EYX3_9FLAO|nr:saccharopine dehydrogenase NADP-binding domain-containing protein [Cerina litoralis]MCG2462729.1 saccharopine dehydrogenase NADP-binding domain-containing protein [Cerina litoralis]
MKGRILIYGATGYTGKLFTDYLLANNYKPILAARSNKVISLGKELNCETRIFDTDKVQDNLLDIDILVNLAGPFHKTQNGLIEACLKSKTHYLDIAGEYPEMVNAFQYDDDAKNKNILIIPAAGFGVVPTDIAAKMATDKIINPTHLTIAYATEGGASRGTLHTVLKDINMAGVIIRNGENEFAKPAMKTFKFQLDHKKFSATYNPWRADLFTAQKSTGVQNIETYTVFPGFIVKMMKGKLLWLRNLMLKRIINWMPEGPSAKQLKNGKTYILTIAKNEMGDESRVEIIGPEAYVFTMNCLLNLIEKIKTNTELRGVLTPSSFGVEIINKIEGISIR